MQKRKRKEKDIPFTRTSASIGKLKKKRKKRKSTHGETGVIFLFFLKRNEPSASSFPHPLKIHPIDGNLSLSLFFNHLLNQGIPFFPKLYKLQKKLVL